jgi:phosphoglycolate phosphatase-like HAD superfamily hydrolase
VHGGTDTAILSEACRLAGIPNEILAPQTPAILAAIRAYVAERRSQLQPYLMPGVEATLAHLSGKGALLGVATGNLEEIGWIKLEEAGLRHWFHFGGFSDRFPIRPELVADAARQARAIAGRDARLCVVGDTPRDIAAAHANNLPVIAVATGRYSFEELLADKPQLCVSSLAELLAATQVAS